ncbi:MAG: hypothetical protein RL220_878 [Bacteroidota bacterium]|jgi:hypothetical protein
MAGRTHSESSLGKIIRNLMKENGMEDRYIQARIESCYAEAMGPVIAKRTRRLAYKQKKLIIYLESGVLKEEFSYARSSIVELLNEKLGENLIQEVEIW